ncbi:MAG: response regulator, partial [Planctomycetota bacterium]
MGDPRPKLLVLGGPHVDPGALKASLSDSFELIESSPDDAITTMEAEGIQAVLAEAGDFLPLERGLVTRQSTMLLDAIGEGVCLCDGTGRLLWANQMFREFGDAVQRRVIEVCGLGSEHFAQRRSESNGDGRPLRAKRFKLAFTRAQRYFEVLVSPVRGGDDKLVAGVVRDVSSSERMERKIDAIDRAGRDLAHLDAETIRRMHASERLRLLEERIVKYAHELLHFDHFAVRMLNPRTNELELVMSFGIPEDARGIKLYAEQTGNGLSGYVAATGEPAISNDTTSDPRYVFGLNEPGSSLTVPLRVYDSTVGVFNVESSQKDAFSENDRQFAEIFARYMAGALHTLNLLLVERHTTSETTSGTVRGEISGPLTDLVAEVELLKKQAGGDSAMAPHIDRILRDVASIRRRMKNVTRGAQTLLGVDEVLEAGRVHPELEGRRILVADNEESIRDTIRRVLTAVGCRVVTCDDGTSAIRLLETWQHTHDAEEAFDIVLSDINLGDRTGYDVFEAAKAASAKIPVILMTGFGYDPHHSIVRATQEGLQAVLFKPFQADKLIEDV